MKKTLKVLSLALALVMTMSLLAACGGKKDEHQVTVGMTLFEPMNYYDENGNLVGFETEFATAVFEKLGMTPKFQEINWDSKVMELNSKNIDCLWNGMTATEDLKQSLTLSLPYVQNYQVIVIRSENAAVYKSTADLAGAKIDAEAGSAGEKSVLEDVNLSKAIYTSVPMQTEALKEVKTGAADACVLDYVLAKAMVGQGDYADLAIIPDLRLSIEEYTVGFRKNDPMAEKVNGAIVELYQDGTLMKLAEKYGLADQLMEQK